MTFYLPIGVVPKLYPNGLHHYPMLAIRAEQRPAPTHPSVTHVWFCGERMAAFVYRWVDPIFPADDVPLRPAPRTPGGIPDSTDPPWPRDKDWAARVIDDANRLAE